MEDRWTILSTKKGYSQNQQTWEQNVGLLSLTLIKGLGQGPVKNSSFREEACSPTISLGHSTEAVSPLVLALTLSTSTLSEQGGSSTSAREH